MNAFNLSQLAGVTLVKLNLVALDHEVPEADSRSLVRWIGRECDARGWPDGWYEDPSVLSPDHLSDTGSRRSCPECHARPGFSHQMSCSHSGIVGGDVRELVERERSDVGAPTLARAFGVDRASEADPIAGLALREVYRAGGQTLTRQMIRDVAAAIRNAPGTGIRASEIAESVTWGKVVYGTDRRIDRALQILRGRGVIRQGKYPRWVWARGTTNAFKEPTEHV